jgi:glycosyltransferase involved in cell wall biosynthesis
MDNGPLDVAVVVPTKNRPVPLARLVSALLAQTSPPAELIVVDQSATDESRRAVERLVAEAGPPGRPELVYVLDPSIDGAAAARNDGLRRARAPLVAFLDDDGIPDAAALEILAGALRDAPELVGVGGIITTYARPAPRAVALSRLFHPGPFWDERQPVYWDWARVARGQRVPTGKLNGGLMVCRRDALLAEGGFDPRYRGPSVGEDVEISQRLERHAPGRALALVGGAWLAHASAGEWKRSERDLEFELVATTYRYRKNMRKDAATRLAYGVFVAGLFALGLARSARGRSAAPLRSVLRGVRCVRADYAGCPFLAGPKARVERS